MILPLSNLDSAQQKKNCCYYIAGLGCVLIPFATQKCPWVHPSSQGSLCLYPIQIHLICNLNQALSHCIHFLIPTCCSFDLSPLYPTTCSLFMKTQLSV